jgi:CRP-like cAMP-binding protein
VYFITEGEVSCYVHRSGEPILHRKKPVLKGEDGECEPILKALKGKLFLLNSFNKSSYIGEIDIFVRRPRETYAIVTRDAHLMVLSRTDLESVIKDEFPHIYAEIKDKAIQRLEAEFKSIKEVERLLVCKGKFRKVFKEEKHSHKLASIKKSSELVREMGELETKALDRFPIEDLLGETAAHVPDLPLEKVTASGFEVLFSQLQRSSR